jgi:predicted nucleic acid-binding protein
MHRTCCPTSLSGIRSLVHAGALSEDDAVTGLAGAAEIPLLLHPHPGDARILRMAGRQGTKAAYDAAYLELAERLDAELWTLDRRLRHHAEAIGIRVQLVSEPG